MAMGNNTLQVGNVTRDPELRFTPSGQATCNFGLAVNERWQNKQTQEWEESTSFFNVTCWGTLADNVAESVAKGTRVIVAGKLQQRSWEDQKTNEKKSVVEIVADAVGPDLRWATAQVVRAERSEGNGQQQRAGAGASRGSQGNPQGYSEEPF